MAWDPHRFGVEAGVTPYHPGTWPGLIQVGFTLAQLAQFRASWREVWTPMLDAEACGACGAIRYANASTCAECRATRARRIQRVRNEVRQALAPLPSNLYTVCPCHPGIGRPLRDALGYARWPRPAGDVSDDEVAAWVAEAPVTRTFIDHRRQHTLATIDRCDPARPAGNQEAFA